MSVCEKAEEPCISASDIQYLERRIERNDEYLTNRIQILEKKIRLLVRILVDKKMIGTELAKTFEEAVALPPRDISKIVESYKSSKRIQDVIQKNNTSK